MLVIMHVPVEGFGATYIMSVALPRIIVEADAHMRDADILPC